MKPRTIDKTNLPGPDFGHTPPGLISRSMQPFIRNNSAIRAMFEEGLRMQQEFGAENVFDFSLGNPNVPAPGAVEEAILRLVKDSDPVVLHGYMPNAGFPEVRRTLAEDLNRRFGTGFSACLLAGFSRKFAVKYSMLMSIPAVIGGMILELTSVSGPVSADPGAYIVGTLVSAVVAFFSIRTMLRIVSGIKPRVFAFYCVIVGVIFIAVSFAL